MLSAMDYLPVLFVALQCFMPVNGCERINFTIHPTTVYVGDKLTFMCSTNVSADVTVGDLGNNSVSCDVVEQRTVYGVFAESDSSCFNNEGAQVHAVANATTDMRGKNYTCTATVHDGKQRWTSSCNRKIHVLDVPELSLTPTDMTFNDDQNVTIGCFTNSTELDPSITLTLSIWNNTRQLKMNASVNRVETTFSVARDFHEATVRCEALQVSRIKAKKAILRVNYIFPKRSIVKYHSANGSHTFNCAEHVESRPGVQYRWFSANSTKAIETQSSYICKAPQWCNISVTCVATNNVTRAQSSVTFIYQNHPIELNSNDVSFIDMETVKEKDHYTMIIAMSVACTVGTLVIVSIMVVVWKWRIYKRSAARLEGPSRHSPAGERFLPPCTLEGVPSDCNETNEYETVNDEFNNGASYAIQSTKNSTQEGDSSTIANHFSAEAVNTDNLHHYQELSFSHYCQLDAYERIRPVSACYAQPSV